MFSIHFDKQETIHLKVVFSNLLRCNVISSRSKILPYKYILYLRIFIILVQIHKLLCLLMLSSCSLEGDPSNARRFKHQTMQTINTANTGYCNESTWASSLSVNQSVCHFWHFVCVDVYVCLAISRSPTWYKDGATYV